MKKKAPSATRGTLEYFKYLTWNNLQQRVVNGSRPNWQSKRCKKYLIKGTKCEFTKQEWYQWCDQRAKEILEMYACNETPSIDRINPDLHYSLNNIRILSYKENSAAGLKKQAENKRRPIAAYTKNGGRIEARSMIALAEILGVAHPNIIKVLQGKYKHCGGYTFKFLTKELSPPIGPVLL